MDIRQHIGDSSHSVEGIRAQEVERLLSKLSIAPEQTEVIGNLSRSLVDELFYGPIAETAARVQMPSELAASGERWRGREGVRVGGAQ